MAAAAVAPEVACTSVARARSAQRLWVNTSIRERLTPIRKARLAMARKSQAVVDAFPTALASNLAERLAGEIIPTAEACRYLEAEAEQLLAPRRLQLKKTPFWLRGIKVEQRREPLGVVLIIGPANYPLFLPAVQTIQALVAGNAVVIKPGLGGGPVMRFFCDLLRAGGIAPDLLHVLDEDPASARAAIDTGVDKVIFTGSLAAGNAVYEMAAARLTPITLELSGYDPVFVLASADLARVARAVNFGVTWNCGNTCIAPRRVFAHESVSSQTAAFCALPVVSFRTAEEALQLAEQSRFALGASVFGQEQEAQAFATRVRAGCITINDVIMPTADPRVSFGGSGDSGFGRTRGPEGLLQMTAAKTVITQRGRRPRHLEKLPHDAESLFAAYLRASHTRDWRDKWSVLKQFIQIRSNRKHEQS